MREGYRTIFCVRKKIKGRYNKAAKSRLRRCVDVKKAEREGKKKGTPYPWPAISEVDKNKVERGKEHD